MSRTATYHTTVAWTGEHWGQITLGNGPEMRFSAPPDAQGHPGVLTPEDAFVAAANTCVMMMFIWATERFRLDLQSYDCRAEGTKLIELDRTETFTHLRLWPQIRISAGVEQPAVVEARARRALQSAQKYSLVANSVRSEIDVEPGQWVEAGATIGHIGSTGRSTGPHLHYEVRVHKVAVNPHKYLRTTYEQIAFSDSGEAAPPAM